MSRLVKPINAIIANEIDNLSKQIDDPKIKKEPINMKPTGLFGLLSERGNNESHDDIIDLNDNLDDDEEDLDEDDDDFDDEDF